MEVGDLERHNTFESELAQFIGTRYCVGTNMGRTALYVALHAAGISKGDEVILPGYACEVVASAIVKVGARPIFVDINADNYAMNVDQLSALISDKTKAIIAIHTFGYPDDLNLIKSVIGNKKITLIEDAAHSLGATYDGRKVGGIGDIGIFSLTKNIADIGGGAIVTDDSSIASKIKNRVGKHGGSNTVISQTYLGLISYLDNYRINSSSIQIFMSLLEEFPSKFPMLGNEYKESGKIPDIFRISRIQEIIAEPQLNRIDEINKHRQMQCTILDSITGCCNSHFVVNSKSVPTPLWYVLRLRCPEDVKKIITSCLKEGLYLTTFWQRIENFEFPDRYGDLVNVTNAQKKTLVFKLAPTFSRKRTERIGAIISEKLGII